MPNFRIYMYTSIAILMLKIREGGSSAKISCSLGVAPSYEDT